MPKKILVVDDDAHIREVVQFALEKAGLDMIEARRRRAGAGIILPREPWI